jgi:hypothetical protein
VPSADRPSGRNVADHDALKIAIAKLVNAWMYVSTENGSFSDAELQHPMTHVNLLAFNRLPPMSMPIRNLGCCHRSVLLMPLDVSYPGIQPTTARKAVELLTVTNNSLPAFSAGGILGCTRNPQPVIS